MGHRVSYRQKRNMKHTIFLVFIFGLSYGLENGDSYLEKLETKINELESANMKREHEYAQLKEDLEILKREKEDSYLEKLEMKINELESANMKREHEYAKLKEENQHYLEILEREVEENTRLVRNPPVLFQCAYTTKFSMDNAPVTYQQLFYSKIESITEEGGFELVTGLFTSPFPGTYTITYNLEASVDEGTDILLHTRKNGEEIPESRHYSYYGGQSGQINDQGARTIIVHLDRGETVDLFCNDCLMDVFQVMTCVTLSQFDVDDVKEVNE